MATNGVLSHSATVSVTVTSCQQVVFVHGKLSWTHHLVLSKNPAGQTFTAHVEDLTATPQYVVIKIHGTNGVGGSFDAMSTPTLVQLGVVTDITFSQFIDPASVLVNTKICFTAQLYFGDTAATAMTNLSTTTKSGCFAIVP